MYGNVHALVAVVLICIYVSVLNYHIPKFQGWIQGGQ